MRCGLALGFSQTTPRRVTVQTWLAGFAAGGRPRVLNAVHHWRERHAALDMTLVRGNHDNRAGDPPAEARIDVVDEPWLLGPFACCHHPQAHPTHFVLAGHLHPVCHLSGPARDRLRLPCFVSEPGLAVLPAFGAFTGGHPLAAASGRQFFAVGGQRVWEVPRG